MKRSIKDLRTASEGAAAIEFILAAPFLILLVVGILQLGILFLAKAGLEQAVEAGARYATIYPAPSQSQIQARVLASGYGMQSSGIVGPTFAYGNSGGSPYVEITMSYRVTPNFIFFQLPAIELQRTRRAYQVT